MLGITLIAVLTLLCPFSAALASGRGTAHYEYKAIRLTYKANGELLGWQVPGQCLHVAMWEGQVETEAESSLISPFVGKASLTIGPHGSSGSGYVKADAKSTFNNAFHRETTACDESEHETAFTMTPCGGTLDSKMHVSMRFSGGVGTRVKVVWDFVQYGGASGGLVPDSFSCVEPFKFPDQTGVHPTCTSMASLGQFTHRYVHLSFRCFYEALTPPPGSNYTKYTASAFAFGDLELKRH